jgi:hypothetical protein
MSEYTDSMFKTVKGEFNGHKVNVEYGVKTNTGILVFFTYLDGPNKGELATADSKQVKVKERINIFE